GHARSGAAADVPSLLTAVGLPPADLNRPATPEPDTAGPDPGGPRVAGPGAVEQRGGAVESGAVERDGGAVERAEAAVVDVSTRLDLLGRSGDARLAGVLATLLHGTRRAWLGPRLVAPLGMPLARRVADLVGLHAGLHRRFPDEERRASLVRLAVAADLGVLHAVAAAVLAGPTDPAA